MGDREDQIGTDGYDDDDKKTDVKKGLFDDHATNETDVEKNAEALDVGLAQPTLVLSR